MSHGSLCPWIDLDEHGNGLTVNEFLTTRTSRLMSGLRRAVTRRYALQFGLSVSEWRVLSLVAHTGTLPFGELVARSTSDKALVSRTVRLLEQRGLVKVNPGSENDRKRLVVAVTPMGKKLHAKIMPIARQRQAQVIRALGPREREQFYRALIVLTEFVEAPEREPGGAAPDHKSPAEADRRVQRRPARPDRAAR